MKILRCELMMLSLLPGDFYLNFSLEALFGKLFQRAACTYINHEVMLQGVVTECFG